MTQTRMIYTNIRLSLKTGTDALPKFIPVFETLGEKKMDFSYAGRNHMF